MLVPTEINEEEFLPIGQAAKLISVTPETLRRWERIGKIKSYRITPVSRRSFKVADLKKALSADPTPEKEVVA